MKYEVLDLMPCKNKYKQQQLLFPLRNKKCFIKKISILTPIMDVHKVIHLIISLQASASYVANEEGDDIPQNTVQSPNYLMSERRCCEYSAPTGISSGRAEIRPQKSG